MESAGFVASKFGGSCDQICTTQGPEVTTWGPKVESQVWNPDLLVLHVPSLIESVFFWQEQRAGARAKPHRRGQAHGASEGLRVQNFGGLRFWKGRGSGFGVEGLGGLWFGVWVLGFHVTRPAATHQRA